MLVESGDYHVTVMDINPTQLDSIRTHPCIAKRRLDVDEKAALIRLLHEHDAVLCATPFSTTTRVCEAAAAAGVHYLDLTEDVASSRQVEDLSRTASAAFVPQCGLAPGFVSIVAYDLVRRFDTVDSVRMRVGALPQYPSNTLSYNLTWSTEGVINEYIEPCLAIENGELVEVPALEGREELSIDGVTYEAFNTSGGLGTLVQTLEGKVRTLNYRTIRYPGHVAIMKTLLNDLRLRDQRDLLKGILEGALATTIQDVVIVFVTVIGTRDGRHVQETYVRKIYSQPIAGILRSAIQVTTAGSICAALDLLLSGALPEKGFIRQEDIDLSAFLANRFGAVYSPSARESLAA